MSAREQAPAEPTIAAAIQEAEAWLWSLEGFEADTRRMAKESDEQGRGKAAAELHAAADTWLMRTAAMRRAVALLRVLANHEDEIRELVRQKRAARSGRSRSREVAA